MLMVMPVINANLIIVLVNGGLYHLSYILLTFGSASNIILCHIGCYEKLLNSCVLI